MIAVALLIIAITAIVVFYWHQLYFWKRRGIPGPNPRLFVGNYLQINDPSYSFPIVVRDWTKKYGKYFGIQEGIRKFLVVSDPDMLQELFVKKFDHFYGRKNFQIVRDLDSPSVHLFEAQGTRWKRLRTISAPSFSTNSLKKVRRTVEESALELIRLLEETADKTSVNIHNYYQEFTLDAISRIAMGQKESTFFNNYRIKSLQVVFGRDVRHPLFLLATVAPSLRTYIRAVFDFFGRLFGGYIVTLYKDLGRAVDERIAEREKELQDGLPPREPEDFIDLFLDARSENIHGEEEYSRTDSKVSRHMTKEEVVAQCFVFLLAGYDTTSNALAYTSWLLAMNPEKQKKLQAEIDEVCGNEEEIEFEKLNKLKYTECVLKEALRMYPLGAFACSRRCMKSTTLGDLQIEEGTYVLSDSWTIHYDKKIWGDDADQFVPERWERGETRHPMAWFPFGAGPRVCIGQRLAYMEEKLALCHLLRKFNIVAGEKTEKQLKLVGSSVVSPAAVTVYIKSRQ